MLAVESVSKVFPASGTNGEAVAALATVDLSVAEGEFVALIGPSGCGKSTLINVIAGIVDGYEGRVLIDGDPISGKHAHIGMVFQEDSTFPWLTARENVEFGLRMRGVPAASRKASALEMLDLLGLASCADRYPAELSGGMRQRVAIARALVLKPRLLLMDEPFGAVDEQTRIVLGEELLKLQQQLGQTIVFVTHNLGEAVSLSDRVVAMTARPAKIKEILTVDLPHPRDSSIIESERYAQLVGHLWHLLRDEALQTFRAADDRAAG